MGADTLHRSEKRHLSRWTIMSTEIGNPAPDLKLTDDTGHEVQLSSLWRQQPLVLIFVRHLG
jgi:hypothetical protein